MLRVITDLTTSSSKEAAPMAASSSSSFSSEGVPVPVPVPVPEQKSIVRIADKVKHRENRAYMRPDELKLYRVPEENNLYLARVNELVVRLSEDNKLKEGEIAMNELHCEFAKTKIGESVIVNSFELPPDFAIVELFLELKLENPNSKSVEINAIRLGKELKATYSGQVMSVGQRVKFKYTRSFTFSVIRLSTGEKSTHRKQGLLSGTTKILFNPLSKYIKIMKQDSIPYVMFHIKKSIEMIKQELMCIGIGGMSTLVATICETVNSTRLHSELKLPHVKGILLHGPPGTGKTLLARKLAELLQAKEPKVVNGPALLDPWVGRSEQNVRELFAEAKQDFEVHGENSPLHIIILDEIDSIAQKRGRNPADTTSDRVVNQLLTEIDGVKEMNNILVVGTTNRKDLIDDALLRSGRLELHIAIGLPDEPSRQEILKVHTDKVAEHKIMLQSDVDFKEIASRTTGRTGADLAAIVRTAVVHAKARAMSNKEDTVMVCQDDYVHGVEVICLAPENHVVETLEKYRSDAKLEYFDGLLDILDQAAKKIEESEEQLLVTCLLFGPVKCGKTTLAAFVPRKNTFKHVNLVSPNSMIEFSEKEKVAKLVQVFEEARRFPLSLIILDDIERLVEYNALQHICSSLIVNTLLIQLKEPPKNTKMLVVGTTSNKEALQEMGICNLFPLKIEIQKRKQEECHKLDKGKQPLASKNDALHELGESSHSTEGKADDWGQLLETQNEKITELRQKVEELEKMLKEHFHRYSSIPSSQAWVATESGNLEVTYTHNEGHNGELEPTIQVITRKETQVPRREITFSNDDKPLNSEPELQKGTAPINELSKNPNDDPGLLDGNMSVPKARKSKTKSKRRCDNFSFSVQIRKGMVIDLRWILAFIILCLFVLSMLREW